MERSLPRGAARRSPAGLPYLSDLLSNQQPPTSSDSIVALLRKAALKNQRDHLRPFYSIRAVAAQFHIPRATVGRIYRRLSDERLLRPVWGSKTLLEPANSGKGKQLRTIGIAVDLGRFRRSREYGDHVLTLQNAVRRHGITEHLIFFHNVDEVLGVLKHQYCRRINTLLWPFPDAHHERPLLRLRDMGIRVICLGTTPIRGIRYCYSVSRRGNLGRIVRDRILTIL